VNFDGVIDFYDLVKAAITFELKKRARMEPRCKLCTAMDEIDVYDLIIVVISFGAEL